MRKYSIQKQIQLGQARNYILIILFSILIIAIAATAFVFFISPKKVPAVCGDNVCDSSENCYDCSQDCKCSGSNSYCNSTQKKCITSRCGNGVCEPYESMENCCEDCGCSSIYQVCNKTTHKCEIPEANISDQRVRELATEYYTNKSQTISEFGIISLTVYSNKPAKSIGVKLQGDLQLHMLIITEDEQIFEQIFQ
jgi:hypothetical protein